MNINLDNETLTRYVLGEVTNEEREAIVAALEGDAGARAEVEEIRAAAKLTEEVMLWGQAPELTDEQRGAIFEKAGDGIDVRPVPQRSRLRFAAAAAFFLLLGGGIVAIPAWMHTQRFQEELSMAKAEVAQKEAAISNMRNQLSSMMTAPASSAAGTSITPSEIDRLRQEVVRLQTEAATQATPAPRRNAGGQGNQGVVTGGGFGGGLYGGGQGVAGLGEQLQSLGYIGSGTAAETPTPEAEIGPLALNERNNFFDSRYQNAAEPGAVADAPARSSGSGAVAPIALGVADGTEALRRLHEGVEADFGAVSAPATAAPALNQASSAGKPTEVEELNLDLYKDADTAPITNPEPNAEATAGLVIVAEGPANPLEGMLGVPTDKDGNGMLEVEYESTVNGGRGAGSAPINVDALETEVSTPAPPEIEEKLAELQDVEAADAGITRFDTSFERATADETVAINGADAPQSQPQPAPEIANRGGGLQSVTTDGSIRFRGNMYSTDDLGEASVVEQRTRLGVDAGAMEGASAVSGPEAKPSSESIPGLSQGQPAPNNLAVSFAEPVPTVGAVVNEAGVEMVPLQTEIPKPQFSGTPRNIKLGRPDPNGPNGGYSVSGGESRNLGTNVANGDAYEGYTRVNSPAPRPELLAAGEPMPATAAPSESVRFEDLQRLSQAEPDDRFGYTLEQAPDPAPESLYDESRHYWGAHNTEAYDRIEDNPFKKVSDEPLSTFSIDVDTASYANVRRFLTQGQLPPPDAVRIEEMVNYFDYSYPCPDEGTPFSASMLVASCPWKPEHRLARIGLQGWELPQDSRPASNLVFLLDVSGSMRPANKLPLLKQGMKMLTQQLDERDSIAIVVYAGAAGMVLPPTPGGDQRAILGAIDRLESGGSTNGGAGIELAYDTAAEHLIKGGVNRVILATDGDFNVGTTDRGQLTRMVEEKAKTGVYLTILGFGMGNTKDATLEELSNKGNGNYAYIDTLAEAKKVLVEEMGSTLVTIAKDVKIQIEFNPAEVAGYRLIGYENRVMAAKDFNDDTKDAGEIGAGHTVTALYELVPAGVAMPTPGVDALKYQAESELTQDAHNGELLTLKLRYKQPDEDTSALLEFPIRDHGAEFASAPPDFKFAASVAAFGMLLRNSEHRGSATLDSVLELAEEGRGEDAHGYRAEFIALVKKAQPFARR